jgi:hypothetical protein
MGSLRFRKQIKLAPGLKLNINKKSAGVTLGGRGARMTFNTKGQRTTSVGVPGTGLWYRDTKTVGSRSARAASRRPVGNQEREAAEAEAWLSAHTREGKAADKWMGELYEWAGTDPARRAQAREMVIAHMRQWVESAVDMGQHNRFVRTYAQTLSKDANFEALADEAQRQADAQLGIA